MSENVMLQEAIDAIRQGQRSRARDLLARLLRADQNNPQYWLWMSAVVDSLKEQIYCLQTVLRLEPGNNAARHGLVLLGAIPADQNLAPVPPIRRKWETPLDEAPAQKGLRRVWANPYARVLVFVGLAVVVVGLIVGGIFGLESGKTRGVAFLPTKTSGPPSTFTPTPTYVNVTPRPPTRTPINKSPTPLAVLPKVNYTPTALYVNTPHAVSEAYRIAQRAFERGDWKNALLNMQQAAKSSPESADIQYYIGEIYRFQGQNEAALAAYNQALKLDAQFAPAYLGRARVRLALKPKSDISDDLQNALDNDPNFGEAYLVRAAFLLSQGKAKAALEDLQATEPLLPDSATRFLYLAQVQLALDDPAAALDAARRANELDQTSLPVYQVLGEAALLTGDLQQAIEALKIYVSYRADDANGWADLGQALYETRQYTEALTALDKALENNDELATAYLYRGLVNQTIGQGQEAVNDLLVARRSEPKSFTTNIALGQALLLTGRVLEARDQIGSCFNLAKSDEERAQVFYWRALAQETLGSIPLAANDWHALLALPRSAVTPEWQKTAEEHLVLIATATPTASATATNTATPQATNTPEPTATLLKATQRATIKPPAAKTPTPRKK